MGVLAYTIAEARDHILKSVNAESSETYQAWVLDFLNHAQTYICSQHKWMFLQRKSTATTTVSTGILTLPVDVDRVLAIYETDSDRQLTLVSPQELVKYLEDDSITEPSVYTYRGYATSSEDEAPYDTIEIVPHPAIGVTYNIYYIRHMDELTAAKLNKVPRLPINIWQLIRQKAKIDFMVALEKQDSLIKAEQSMFVEALISAKMKEDTQGPRYMQVGLDGYMEAYYKTRYQ